MKILKFVIVMLAVCASSEAFAVTLSDDFLVSTFDTCAKNLPKFITRRGDRIFLRAGKITDKGAVWVVNKSISRSEDGNAP